MALAEIVLVYTPGVDETTFTLTVQVPLGAIVALLIVREVSPLAIGLPPGPVTLGEPHAPNVTVEFAMTTLVGKLSVREVCVNEADVSLFRIVIVSVLVCATHTVLGAKLLLSEGGWTALICRVALAGVVFVTEIVPVGSVETNVFAGRVFTWLPAIVDVTFTVTVQEPGVLPTWAGTVPPRRDNTVPEVVTIPPQSLVALLGLAKFRFAPVRSSVQAGGLVDRLSANEFGL
jgi:hypothetical protein